MRRFIRLSNGTELPASSCGENSGSLWIHVRATMHEAYEAFGFPENLGLIEDITEEDGQELRRVEWEGYTELTNLTVRAGEIQVGLTRGGDAHDNH
ncbi:MAG: hypothetical protein J6S60_04810 [Oscillospiraceae bacterium]|nr:hypothetical protein [Oscillospiraceae bacterium]